MSTPLLWPPDPQFAHHTERRVWEALRDQLGERDLLIASQRFSDRRRDYELDIAVAFDGGGVVVVEVKGGTVWADGGSWWQKSSQGDRRISPVEQAMTVKHVLRDWVEASSAWAGRRRVRWAHAVAFPDIVVDPQFDMPDCHRWMVIDRLDLDDIATRLRNIPELQDSDYRMLEVDDIVALHGSLNGRFLPQRDSVLPVSEVVADHDAVAERLSAEQGVILDAIKLLERVEVRGGAGSGKTWLAVEQARRLTRDGQRVALLSYSRGLAAWMQRRIATFDADEQPAYVGTFHGLGKDWGAPEGSDDDSDFWERRLPAQMVDLAREQSPVDLYDAIVIDEAQDFADAWWPVIESALRFEDGGLYVFTDEGQRIFSRFGSVPSGLIPLVLEQNLRNTKQISRTFTSMAPHRMRPSSYEGVDVRFVPCTNAEAVEVADDQVDVLLDAGWQPSDVALLTTQSRHPEHLNRADRGFAAYWDSFWDVDQVFYGTVLGFKGLERPAIVLAINDRHDMDRAKERLYVGLSRARDLLVVCGDPDHIERVAGPEVLALLRGA